MHWVEHTGFNSDDVFDSCEEMEGADLDYDSRDYLYNTRLNHYPDDDDLDDPYAEALLRQMRRAREHSGSSSARSPRSSRRWNGHYSKPLASKRQPRRPQTARPTTRSLSNGRNHRFVSRQKFIEVDLSDDDRRVLSKLKTLQPHKPGFIPQSSSMLSGLSHFDYTQRFFRGLPSNRPVVPRTLKPRAGRSKRGAKLKERAEASLEFMERVARNTLRHNELKNSDGPLGPEYTFRPKLEPNPYNDKVFGMFSSAYQPVGGWQINTVPSMTPCSA